MRARRAFPAIAVALLAASAAHASRLVVPDDAATIQQALDAGPDTVLVRDGIVPETPELRRRVVLASHPGNAGKPVLAGMWIRIEDETRVSAVHVEGLRLTGGVALQTWDSWLGRLSFTDCDLEAGLQHTYTKDETVQRILVHGGSIGSIFSARPRETFELLGVVVTGSVAVGAPKMGQAIVRGNVFADDCDLCRIGLQIADYSSVEIADNHFAGYENGAQISSLDGVVTGNRVERASRNGMLLGIERPTIADNVVTGCVVGLQIHAYEAEIARNRVLASSSVGIELRVQFWANLRENVVGRSGSAGFDVWMEGFYPVRLANNTAYLNAGSGFAIRGGFPTYEPPDSMIVRNVAFGNGRYGLEWSLDRPGELRCNDWYANGLGAVSGIAMGASDREVDPSFCAIDEDDVSLRMGSPLLEGDCGQVGALGMGCDAPTATLVSLAAEALPGAIELRWRLEGELAGAWIERATESAAWSRVPTERRLESGFTVERDTEVEPGRVYSYRLCWIDGSGAIESSPTHTMTALAVARDFTLGPLAPNPASGAVRIGFALPRRSRVGLTLIDSMGRRIASLAEGDFEPGVYEARWDGAVRGRAAAPGLYFVVLRTDAGVRIAKLLVAR